MDVRINNSHQNMRVCWRVCTASKDSPQYCLPQWICDYSNTRKWDPRGLSRWLFHHSANLFFQLLITFRLPPCFCLNKGSHNFCFLTLEALLVQLQWRLGMSIPKHLVLLMTGCFLLFEFFLKQTRILAWNQEYVGSLMLACSPLWCKDVFRS